MGDHKSQVRHQASRQVVHCLYMCTCRGEPERAPQDDEELQKVRDIEESWQACGTMRNMLLCIHDRRLSKIREICMCVYVG